MARQQRDVRPVEPPVDSAANAGGGTVRRERPRANFNQTATVWFFFVTTVAVSAMIVYLIGHRLDNPDAAILAVIVPSTVAIVMTARRDGWSGVRYLLRLRGTSAPSVRLVLFATFAIPMLAVAAVAIGNALSDESPDVALPSDGLIVLLPLLIIALGEEYGWRGFALPRLQTRWSALTAALIVGSVHWLWHYPAALINTGVPLNTPFWLFGLYVVALSVLMTSVFNAGGSSIGLMILMHFVSNVSFVFLPLLPENRGGDLTAFSVFVGLATILAAVVVAGPIGRTAHS